MNNTTKTRPKATRCFSDLPIDCSCHVLSFLKLKSVLNFSECSVTCMNESLHDIFRRRESMFQTYAYNHGRKTLSCLDDVNSKSQYIKHAFNGYSDWEILPTVVEQVEQLFKHIPPSHPCAILIHCCLENLKQVRKPKENTKYALSFATVFALFKAAVGAHKLHAQILHTAISSDPLDSKGRTSLDQYIGDVLCLAYLTNQSSLGLVEGGPTSTTIVKDLRYLPPQAMHYRSWVYMHSSVLRTRALAASVQTRIGIDNSYSISEIIPNNYYVSEKFLSSKMTLVYNDFGPLGPTFRQRDVVRVNEISAHQLFVMLITNDYHALGEIVTGAVEWMCLMHEQSRNVQPLTVRPPIIQLEWHSVIPH